MARQLGPTYFGTFSMLLSFVSLFTPLIALGLNAIVTRELCVAKVNEGKVIGTVVFLRLIGVLLGALCILLIANNLIDTLEAHYYLIVILVIGNSFSLFNFFEFWFQSRMESKYVSIIRTVVLIVFSLVKLSVAYTEPVLINFIVVQAVEWLTAGCVLGVFYLFKRSKIHQLEIDISYGVGLLRESVWLIFSGVAAVIYLKIDQLMLGIMVDEATVGIYSIAVKFSEIWYFFPTALAASFFPKLLKDKDECTNKYENSLQLLLDGMFAFSLFIILFTILFSKSFIPFLYGDEYLNSAGLLNIQIWACCFVFMRAVTSKWLLAESLVKYSLVSQGAGACINVAMNYFLIPIWHAEGAAWSTLFSYFFASYLSFWFFKETRPIAKKMTMALTFPVRIKSSLQKLSLLRKS